MYNGRIIHGFFDQIEVLLASDLLSIVGLLFLILGRLACLTSALDIDYPEEYVYSDLPLP
jgi:hypothetical protein